MVVHMELPDQRLRRPGQRYIMFFNESPQTYPYDYERCRQHQLFIYKLREILYVQVGCLADFTLDATSSSKLRVG